MSWTPPDPLSYSYLLGLYLGDGHLWIAPSGYAQLGIACDPAYPALVDACWAAMQLVATGTPVARYRMKDGCVRVVAAWRGWPAVFPQHGAGPKHERPIVLQAWQREVVDAFPHEFLRGLIHSDGCRTINRFTTRLPSGRVAEYAYPRYFFSNLSPDIRGLFCEYCDRLGIRWSQSNHRNISVSHRDAVARLDAFVGPKR